MSDSDDTHCSQESVSRASNNGIIKIIEIIRKKLTMHMNKRRFFKKSSVKKHLNILTSIRTNDYRSHLLIKKYIRQLMKLEEELDGYDEVVNSQSVSNTIKSEDETNQILHDSVTNSFIDQSLLTNADFLYTNPNVNMSQSMINIDTISPIIGNNIIGNDINIVYSDLNQSNIESAIIIPDSNADYLCSNKSNGSQNTINFTNLAIIDDSNVIGNDNNIVYSDLLEHNIDTATTVTDYQCSNTNVYNIEDKPIVKIPDSNINNNTNEIFSDKNYPYPNLNTFRDVSTPSIIENANVGNSKSIFSEWNIQYSTPIQAVIPENAQTVSQTSIKESNSPFVRPKMLKSKRRKRSSVNSADECKSSSTMSINEKASRDEFYDSIDPSMFGDKDRENACLQALNSMIANFKKVFIENLEKRHMERRRTEENKKQSSDNSDKINPFFFNENIPVPSKNDKSQIKKRNMENDMTLEDMSDIFGHMYRTVSTDD